MNLLETYPRFAFRGLGFAITIALIGAAASAEETDTAEVMRIYKRMEELHSSLVGKTLTIRGAIGTLIGDALYLKNDMGQFDVQFDAGRNARRKVENCELEWFGWENSECIFEFDAEIAIEEPYDFAKGGELKLIIYEVRD